MTWEFPLSVQNLHSEMAFGGEGRFMARRQPQGVDSCCFNSSSFDLAIAFLPGYSFALPV